MASATETPPPEITQRSPLNPSDPNVTSAQPSDATNVGQSQEGQQGSQEGGPSSGLEKVKYFVLTKLLPCLFAVEKRLAQLYTFLKPFILQAHLKLENFLKVYVDPYGRKDVFKSLYGIAMMFFGGFFITTIAVVEAVQQGGSQTVIKSMQVLSQQTAHLREANEKDNKLDEDGDGIADVKQISHQQLMFRKLHLYLKSCEPEVVSEALQALYTVLVCVAATLRLRFARAVSLGASIGDVLMKPIQKYIIPKVKNIVEEDLQKWIRPTTSYLCRAVGVSIALYLNRILSTVFTAFRGARLLTDGVTALSQKNGFSNLTDGVVDDILAFALAFVGIYSQFFVFPYLPFIVQLLLFPATFTEWLLSMLVSAAM